jgi:hypothetical protein
LAVHARWTVTLLALLALGASGRLDAQEAGEVRLPPRVRRIVLHTLGNPAYDRPQLRFAFLAPPQTQALWKRGFGAHWIVWTDGSLWPRRVAGAGRSWRPVSFDAASPAERRRLAWEAAPVLAHLHNGNRDSVGIELAHSGRRDEPFPEAQAQAAAWLVRTLLEMSNGRLGPADVFGHKDLDRRPAYLRLRCARSGCPVFVDDEGKAYRRRVDPPESLFATLGRYGLAIPRPPGGDDELIRAEQVPPGAKPDVAHALGARTGAIVKASR